MALIKIKQFSELVGLSVRTLQYYDEIGLLVPENVDDYGHRYYGHHNFTCAFIINSLKQVGMSLKDIESYLSDSTFSIRVFVEEEKKRIEDEISALQRKRSMLENIQIHESQFSLRDPAIIALFSQENLDPLELAKIVELPIDQLVFDLAETSQFMKELDYCRQNQLTIRDPLAKKCGLYWQRVLNSLGESKKELTKVAELNYQVAPHSYGMTGENYCYLKGLVELLASGEENWSGEK
ncbi:MerR family transcriptional regulator [Vagococcus sp. BWB3-3]|uniref:MerR family transcriptional regulator n=1 Tax=Vagococcus allomyrinae TaxID=2794353 RepID=A0A940PFN4_9ENTE|nr:MerR family transcriptional regulator [Vagococcus allomyrinae]MBP1043742.1 MerR family transcriptional regulator [Vagococcus allomyrinae]